MNATETTTTLSPMDELIKRNRIAMSIEWTDKNPSMEDGRRMDHYKCTLVRGRRKLTLIYSKGFGHHGKQPTIPEVLDCLASDASGFENARSFEDWCAEYGYSEDSRKAERTFKLVKAQAEALRKILGDSEYEHLLFGMERE